MGILPVTHNGPSIGPSEVISVVTAISTGRSGSISSSSFVMELRVRPCRATFDHSHDLGTNARFRGIGYHAVDIGLTVTAKTGEHAKISILLDDDTFALSIDGLAFGKGVGICGFSAIEFDVVVSTIAIGHD